VLLWGWKFVDYDCLESGGSYVTTADIFFFLKPRLEEPMRLCIGIWIFSTLLLKNVSYISLVGLFGVVETLASTSTGGCCSRTSSDSRSETLTSCYWRVSLPTKSSYSCSKAYLRISFSMRTPPFFCSRPVCLQWGLSTLPPSMRLLWGKREWVFSLNKLEDIKD